MASEEAYDPEYDVPLQDKRPFGSGLKRKRVVFVPASSENPSAAEEKPAAPSKSISDLYLDVVLPKEAGQASVTETSDTVATSPQICQVCHLPLDESSKVTSTADSGGRLHEASLAHQVCLEHSHPPSALDRSRMGLGVLQSQGWDPDSRKGLGAQEQGMQYPLKVKPKRDTLGIGVEIPKNLPTKKEKPQTYDAKKIRKMALQDKRRHEKLRQQLYSNSEVEKYLGDA
ncbi:hypothetical protein F4779DRAFT_11093 [Xylariaceae sp. FL0662B]|nr:hypothetical protein F4779DRAFT_11093 [Xylariaceae sp. FL0662B]